MMIDVISLIVGLVALLLSVLSILLAYWLYLCANARNNLVSQIRDVLSQCRACESWDDRSEMKLFSYIGAEEARLNCYRLRALVEIRNRAYDYLYLHQKMDDECAERMFRSPFCTWRQFVKYELLGAKTGNFVV